MKIGLISGSGSLPIIFSKKALEKGHLVYAVAHKNETDTTLKGHVKDLIWVQLGEIDKIINFFKINNINQAVMIGGIKKTEIFSSDAPDKKVVSLISDLKNIHDDALLIEIANLFESMGIKILSSTFLLPEIIADKGCWTKRVPAPSEKKDIKLGWRMAKEIGKLDIGQCVVISKGVVTAVEAIEGTDAAIKRGAELSYGGAVIVKVSKPDQDLRFDVPAIGTATIETMYKSGAKVLAIEAFKSIVMEKEEVVKLADRYNITVVAYDENDF